MSLLLRRTISSFGRDASSLSTSSQYVASRFVQASKEIPWTCSKCRSNNALSTRRTGHNTIHFSRAFSTSLRQRNEQRREIRQVIEPTTTSQAHSEAETPASSSATLPSHTANRRSDISKRASKILDTLLARASIASQHINAYTGTDYSGIEALRKEIIDQEQKAKDLHKTVDEARAKHHDAHANQTSSQREIVALLERKSSWSPSDLERYMSLVRSEHLNDQDVQIAKDNLTAAERDLEEARSLLERLERKQYHEEQIWSDTIRRNSTWVTFGLMGVNILLLLAQIAIFEPYRRKKIVRDVKSALDDKVLVPDSPMPIAEKQIDAAIPPRSVTLNSTDEGVEQPLDSIFPAQEQSSDVHPLSSEQLPASHSIKPTSPQQTASEIQSQDAASSTGSLVNRTLQTGTLEAYREVLRDLCSERQVIMRMVDITNTALQGAAAGMAVMGLLLVMLRPR